MREKVTPFSVSVEYITEKRLQILIYKTSDLRWEKPRVFDMHSEDGRVWVYHGKARNGFTLHFRFRVTDENSVIDEEIASLCHHATIENDNEVLISSLWAPEGTKSYRFSSAFKYGVSHVGHKTGYVCDKTSQIRYRIYNILVPENKVLALVGNLPPLGAWNCDKALHAVAVDDYTLEVSLPKGLERFEYKYIYIDKQDGHIDWEDGMNRVCDAVPEKQYIIEQVPRLYEDNPRVAGVVIPVFSLRSSRSFGVGDFGDLKQMIDWASSCGMHAVQVLPVNDTTRSGRWEDSYPYNGISAFALHPMYADISSLELKDKDLQHSFFKKAKQLNRLKFVDYEQAVKLKNDYLKVYYSEHTEVVRTKAFREYVATNVEWLVPYASFRVFQEVYGTSDFRSWPAHKSYSKKQVEEWMRRTHHQTDLLYHEWVQFLLENQLKAVHDYARKHRVILKGDIPIGISRDSATAWLSPRYFNFDSQAGAPPDFFSETGQNWGFPTYNWDAIMKDHGVWWQKRLKKMETYFDAYRIDHVLGFMRIWEIPYQYIYGTLGHFSPAMPLSEMEIRNYGFGLLPSDLIAPQFYISDLQALFGENYKPVAKRYFRQLSDGRFRLKKPYLSQRHIIANTDDGKVRDGLMKAASDVLFIQDKNERDKYHPNIAAWRTFAYRYLSEQNRHAYDQLSSDFFFNRHNAWWTAGVMKKLRVLTSATQMLACAEDLGMVPSSMRDVLSRLNILSLEVESMPKAAWGRFSDLKANPYLSVDTITTHDMAPMRLWWQQNREAAQDYFNHILHQDGPAPEEMPSELCEQAISLHLKSPSMLCILALQDWLSMDDSLKAEDPNDEQINNPSVSRHYWRYRMHLTIETLQKSTQFNDRVRQLVAEAGR